MSSYAIIAETSKVLRQILWESFTADEAQAIRNALPSIEAIVFKNPTETARDSSNRLSLWLYQITENEYVKNQPMLRSNGDQTVLFPPLALNLYYLITPFNIDVELDHLFLGRAMQAFYDHAILALRDTTGAINEELRIVLCRMSLEELTRIWEALREPYRLSVCYQVKVTRIDSETVPGTARVIERLGNYTDSPSTIATG